MSYVDFKINTIRQIDSITLDNVVEVKATMYRGHYETIEEVETYVRDEQIGNSLIIFVPNEATEQEIGKELYDILLTEKKTTDEVIPECIYQ